MIANLARLGLLIQGDTWNLTRPLIVGGGLISGFPGGKLIFVDPENGSDNRNGKSPAKAKEMAMTDRPRIDW